MNQNNDVTATEDDVSTVRNDVANGPQNAPNCFVEAS